MKVNTRFIVYTYARLRAHTHAHKIAGWLCQYFKILFLRPVRH